MKADSVEAAGGLLEDWVQRYASPVGTRVPVGDIAVAEGDRT